MLAQQVKHRFTSVQTRVWMPRTHIKWKVDTEGHLSGIQDPTARWMAETGFLRSQEVENQHLCVCVCLFVFETGSHSGSGGAIPALWRQKQVEL